MSSSSCSLSCGAQAPAPAPAPAPRALRRRLSAWWAALITPPVQPVAGLDDQTLRDIGLACCESLPLPEPKITAGRGLDYL